MPVYIVYEDYYHREEDLKAFAFEKDAKAFCDANKNHKYDVLEIESFCAECNK